MKKMICLFTFLLGSFISINSQNRFQQNGSSLYYNNGNVEIGTTSPMTRFMVDGGSATFRDLAANKNEMAMTTLNFLNYGKLGGMHKWCLYVASYGGGWGLPANSYEIWEYPENDNQSAILAQCRFVIESGRNNTVLSSIVIGPKGSLNIGFDPSFRATDVNNLSVNGNVGIGTLNTQGYKLAVNGTIHAKEIKVESGWADFVFDEDYELPSLDEVTAHIKEKNIYPEFPPLWMSQIMELTLVK